MITVDKVKFRFVLTQSQADLFKGIQKYFLYVDKVVEDKYIILKKDNKVKPMLCIHLDTINTHSKCGDKISEAFIVNFGEGFMLKPITNYSCLGADDRAGVYMVLEHYEELLDKYHIGVFCDEEIGGVGSYELTELENVSCFIGLDREGSMEVATYGYNNRELIDLFVARGFKEMRGSFTDASVLAKLHNKPCVNLSVGYYNQHRDNEYVLFEDMEKTLSHILDVDLVFKEDYPIEANKYTSFYDNGNSHLYDYDDRNYGLWDDEVDGCPYCGNPINDGNLNNELVWGHCPHCFAELVEDTAENEFE